jgi:hypothetical protein
MIRPPPGTTSLQYFVTVSPQGPATWAGDGVAIKTQARTSATGNNRLPETLVVTMVFLLVLTAALSNNEPQRKPKTFASRNECL